jgi:hypothetical protein
MADGRSGTVFIGHRSSGIGHDAGGVAARLVLFDERHPRVSLGTLPDGAAPLGLFASDGRPRLTATVLPTDDPAMRLRGEGGDLGLGVPPGAAPRVEITD